MNLFEKAIKTFGKDKQVEQVVEECSELILAIQKNKRFPNSEAYLENLHEEIADVELMLEQMKYVFDPIKIQRYKEEKIKRLENKLNNE